MIAEAPQLIGEMGQFNPSRMRTATVTASCALETLHFKWGAWNDAVKSHLTPEELAALTKALEDYAWQHFTE